MAITQFIEDLTDAINAGNRSKVASLLNSATAANWSAAGTDISYVLTDLSRSRLSAADKANFAKTIVEKGSVNSDKLAETLFDFVNDGNFAAIKNTLTAAAAAELKSDPRFYGDLLADISRSNLTPAQKAELATLLVTKTTVNSDDLAETLFDFVNDGNFAAIKNTLTAAAAAELKSDPRFYGALLADISRSNLTPAQKAELATLLVTKTTVNSDDLAETLFDFVNDGNFAAIKNTLTAAAAAELKSDPRFYGALLADISRSDLTPAQQAEMAKLLVTKTTVDANAVVESVLNFSAEQNFAAVDAVLSSASAAEKSALTPQIHEDLARDGYHSGNDSVVGTSSADVLYGYNGNDRLFGGAGNDTLYGGAGNDRLSGQSGADRLIGGAGADNFVISAKDARDTIVDFSVSQKDVLTIENTLFSVAKTSVENAIDNFVFARTSGNDTIISIDADGKGAGKAVDIAVLQNVKGVDVDVWHAKGLIDIG